MKTCLFLSLALSSAGFAYADTPIPILSKPKINADGQVNITAEATTGQAYVLDSSTDLHSWLAESVALASGGVVSFGADANGFSRIFYRVRGANADETPNPIQVNAAPNTDFVKTRIITSDGGSISLTDDNGTTYLLTVPALALDGFATVTMRVVNDISGLPFGDGLVGGVILEPANLRFYDAATLSISAPTHAPIALSAAFGWNPVNSEFFLAPSSSTATSVTIPLTTLGNFGMAGAISSQLTTIGQHPPSRLADQFSQGVTLDVLAGISARQHQESARSFQAEDANLDALVARFRLRYNIDVIPSLNEAILNDDLIGQAIGDLSNWYFGIQFVAIDNPGLSDQLSTEIADALHRAHDLIINCLENSYSHCLDHDLAKIGKLISCGHLAQTPMLASEFSDGERQLYRKFVQNCAQFEFEMSSDFQYNIKVLGQAHTRVKCLIPVKMQLDAQDHLTTIQGSGAVNVFIAELTSSAVPSPCAYAGANPLNGFGYIDAVDLGLNLISTNRSAPMHIKLLFDPLVPAPDDGYDVTCPSVPPLHFSLWPAFFGTAHHDEIVNAARGQMFSLDDWRVNRGSEEAASYEAFASVTMDSGTGSEVTDFTLHHTPSN